jgi:hypothetical protein
MNSSGCQGLLAAAVHCSRARGTHLPTHACLSRLNMKSVTSLCMQAAVKLYLGLGFCESEDGSCLAVVPTSPHRKVLMKELT